MTSLFNLCANGMTADDIELVHGMPICVQIVGGRFGEEKAIAVAKVVDELMNPTPFHPFASS